MQLLEAPRLLQLQEDSPLNLVSQALDTLPRQAIDNLAWSDAAQKPEVTFSLGYNRNCLFLKYYVMEDSVQAKYREINDPVYKDSCVEFFISFGNEPEYYNLEFNCLGTCLAGFGANREDRQLLPRHKIAAIRHLASLKANGHKARKASWELTLAIPAEVFAEHHIHDFEGLESNVNFYKCGDELPTPHFLSWSAIDAPQPNFHLPEFFGKLNFANLTAN